MTQQLIDEITRLLERESGGDYHNLYLAERERAIAYATLETYRHVYEHSCALLHEWRDWLQNHPERV